MTTHTIEVSEIDGDLLRYLDGRVRANEATDRAAYLRHLLQRDFEQRLASISAMDLVSEPHSERTWAEIARPIGEEVQMRGYTEEEVNKILDDALLEVRQERQAQKSAVETTHQKAA